MSLTLVTAPVEEPLTVDEVKRQCRIDGADDDAYLSDLITAARVHLADRTGIYGVALVTQTLDLTLDDFPRDCRWLKVPLPPLQSVTHVKYLDTAGVLQTMSASLYAVDAVSEPGRIVLAPGSVWPTVQSDVVNRVVVRFVAGYASAKVVPQDIKRAMQLLIAHWYEHREPYLAGGPVPQALAHTIRDLMTNYRQWAA